MHKMKITTILVVVVVTSLQPSGVLGQHQRRNSVSNRNDKEPPFNERSQKTQPLHPNKIQQKPKSEAVSFQEDAQNRDNSNRSRNLHLHNVQLPPPSSAKQQDFYHPTPNSYLYHHHHQSFARQNRFDPNHGDLTPSCSETNGFSPGQIRLCQLYPDHVVSILQAAKLAAEECQFQFSTRRWNCSLLPWGNHSSLLAPPAYMKPGSKEVSLAKAYLSAAMTYVTARACREGLLSQCSCSSRQKPKDLPEDWIWGGCGDNTEYGFMFGVGFVDSREKEMNHPRHSNELLLMLSNTHNNQVGRRVVLSLSKPGCKCHGVSGSCSMKTCWHQLPTFRMVGYELRSKYDGAAVNVKFNKAGTKLIHSYSERKKVVLSKEALRKVSAIKNLKYSNSQAVSGNDVINGNWSIKHDQQIFQLKENSALSGEDRLKNTNKSARQAPEEASRKTARGLEKTGIDSEKALQGRTRLHFRVDQLLRTFSGRQLVRHAGSPVQEGLQRAGRL